MSIVDDPSQWTSKPKDMFGDKVKDSLDKRGWGEIEGGTPTSPTDRPAQQDDGREHTINDYRSLRSKLDDVRSHCRSKRRSHERGGSPDAAKDYKMLEDFVDDVLRRHPMDGGAY